VCYIQCWCHHFESVKAGDKFVSKAENFLTTTMLKVHLCGPLYFCGPLPALGHFASVWPFHTYIRPVTTMGPFHPLSWGWSAPARVPVNVGGCKNKDSDTLVRPSIIPPANEACSCTCLHLSVCVYVCYSPYWS